MGVGEAIPGFAVEGLGFHNLKSGPCRSFLFLHFDRANGGRSNPYHNEQSITRTKLLSWLKIKATN
jgi:hypothetical protein